jgi:hypothetical protein
LHKISFNTKNKRDAPYSVIDREISSGVKIASQQAEHVLSRNKKLDDSDSFILRKDLLGLYIIDQWGVVVTYIDLSSSQKQEQLEKIFDVTKMVEAAKTSQNNLNISLSGAVIKKFSVENLNTLKEVAQKKASKFLYIERYPASFGIMAKFGGDEFYFRMSKKDSKKNITVTIDEGPK